jgi:hypothetical protein
MTPTKPTMDSRQLAEELWAQLPLEPGLVRPYTWLSASRERIISAWCASPTEIAARIETVPRGFDMYIQLNASRLGWRFRPSAQYVPAIQGVLVDLDPNKDVDHTSMDDLDTAYGHLLKSSVNRGQVTVVDSGRGYQLWVLTQNLPPEQAPRIATFLRSFPKMSSCKVDTACSDLPRLARCPGTLNTRVGERAQFLTIGARPKSGDWLRAFPPMAVLPPPEPAPIEGGQNWQVYFSRLTTAAQRFILSGAMRGGRHRGAFAAAASMRDAGAPADVALEAVREGASMCGLDEGSVVSAVRSAYKEFGK